MAGAADLHRIARNVRGEPAGEQRQVLVHADLDPVLRIGRLRRVERHVLARLGERRIVLVGDFAQRLLDAGELALGFDHRGRVGIVLPPGLPSHR